MSETSSLNGTNEPVARLEPTILHLNPEKIVRGLFWSCFLFEILLVLLDGFLNYGRWLPYPPLRRLCNITREDSLASLFGTMQTFVLSGVAALLYLAARGSGATRFVRVGWLILLLLFAYLAIDDGAEIHERIGSSFKFHVQQASGTAADGSFGKGLLDAYPSYPWQPLVLPFLLIPGAFMCWFLWKEFTDVADRLRAGTAAACFAAALLLDFVEGMRRISQQAADALGVTPHTVRHFSKSLEELLEMLAVTLLLVTLVHILAIRYESIRVAFTRDSRERHSMPG